VVVVLLAAKGLAKVAKWVAAEKAGRWSSRKKEEVGKAAAAAAVAAVAVAVAVVAAKPKVLLLRPTLASRLAWTLMAFQYALAQ